MARIAALAEQVFGEPERAWRWLEIDAPDSAAAEAVDAALLSSAWRGKTAAARVGDPRGGLQ